ncbi:chorismate-binding protein [Rummeliibacillus sp. NPDC094406]|uniref:chorismate-binding protein n=1 Tax=Rummeliibacillus sp. NPDC094406 TaxID=3364511 RepID=UPI00382DF479
MIEQTSFRTTIKKINGDLLTPILIFQRLKGKRKFLLESDSKFKDSGRYSMIGVNPIKSYSGSGNTLIEKQFNTEKEYHYDGDLLTLLKRVMPRITGPTEFPFAGGAVGYISYGASVKSRHPNTLQIPNVHFYIYETILVFDHLQDEVTIIHTEVNPEQQKVDLDKIINEIQTQPSDIEDEDYQLTQFSSELSKETFVDQVEKAKEYINDGTVDQIVLSRPQQATYSGNPFSIYRKLRKQNPSPYMYYMDFDDHIILGTSPESLIKVTDEAITINPIGGTRKRGATEEEDQLLAKELLNSTKEQQEHAMIVEVAKEDLMEVAQPGTLQLQQYMKLERFEHVMHLVSSIQGKLSPVYHSLDVLMSAFPAGAITGLPKAKAINLIDEIETSHRNIFGGAIGYIGFNGNVDFAITIRSMLLKDGIAHIQSGAGIVEDSIAVREFDETLEKTNSLTALANIE